MKDLLKKMAQVANELDLKGLEKEANQVTMSMLKVAQAAPSGMLQQRMQAKKGEGKFELSQSSLDEINKFVSEHNLSKQDAYAWITGKFGPRQANDWAAINEYQVIADKYNVGKNQGEQAGQPGASGGAAGGQDGGGQDGNLSLEQIQPLASSKTKKEIFAQGTPATNTPAPSTPASNTAAPSTPAPSAPATNTPATPATGPQQASTTDLKTLLSLAQNIQNATLAQPLANYNSAFNKSFSQGGVQALGELAREYFLLSEQIETTCQSINGLFDKNINSLNKLPPTTKVQAAENIFRPIRKLIAKLQEQRRSKIDPNVGGLFAGNTGGNLENGEEKLNSATKQINDIIKKVGGVA